MKIDVEGAEPAILRAMIAELARFPSEMEIIVEASLQHHASWDDIFRAPTAAGFAAYEIANSYGIEWYLAWRHPTPLRKVQIVPDRQQDLLFSRLPGRR